MRASFFALKRGITLTRLIEDALVAYMARPSKPEPEPAPALQPRKGKRSPSTAPTLPGMTAPTSEPEGSTR